MSWKEDLQQDKIIPSAVWDYAIKHADTYQNFCRWLDKYKDELLIRVFSFRFLKDKNMTACTEVERLLVNEEYCLQKNMYLTQMSGYRVVFEPKDKKGSTYGYSYTVFDKSDYNKWYCGTPMPEYHGKILNLEFLYTIPKYKYCGYSGQQGLREYLQYFEKDPRVEYFGKAGLRYSAMLGNKARKDKNFAKFIMQNVKDTNYYGYKAAAFAYDNKMSFKDAVEYLRKKHEADNFFKNLDKPDYKVDRIKIYDWFYNSESKHQKQNKTTGCWKGSYHKRWDCHSYRDYWNACLFLGLDMRDTKNSMPYDFARMHDLRITQYASKKIALDNEKNKEFDKLVEKVADKFETNVKSEKYIVRLPKKKTEFEVEGEVLNHCVGSMGYDKKVVDGKIIIAFIRDKKAIDKPLYTVEYDLKTKTVAQMHGYNNCTPPKDAQDYINEWAKVIKGMQKNEKFAKRRAAN